ncbi:ATP dependent DNA ligase domain protein [Aspergillus fischeri NRRL 181]|uniref:ATP-dependent DNA ligase, putative n=1 Tax=Neosartorya fischeri (strain ATCC 1020 / DSM 3700 / CBS 544.65 / FGSC A1164 / JCM 1740 / NRRL 181 / WB 181) TaxID=331117 RepID=A1D069_NEOFI|nr:ATP-dependent DNA ligase, putative [Aspergillus fischeri NRRL 181]EAW24389.1 ATP-dependent DNA ligase, putative [Aspergillus fischeri NRRL 181]
MVFKFTYLCDLLSELERNRVLKASTAAKASNPDHRAVTRWFAQHAKRIHASDTDRIALLSCIFPEKRTDRVYWLRCTNLSRVIGRCLLLGSDRRQELEQWRVAGGTDLGQCVENVMRQAEFDIISGQEVTVEEIDLALNKIASRCRFSGSRVRRQHSAVDVEDTLRPLYRRMSSRDAKWLTRMILKSYHPVVLPAKLTMKSFHFLLPHLLLFQDSFDSALKMLASEPLCHYPPNPIPELAKDLCIQALQHLKPRIGTKIGRPEYYKARSIKHCCQMIGRRRMSVERKYDGEYCQIHIDLTKRPNPIQIFSKSGKDSTDDRAGIHAVIKDSLNIGTPECKFSRQCILEGEILVWSDNHGKIADFHKLRKFIARSGTFIGIDNDSPPQPYEHLMIVFFDILLLDDDICLRKPHRERRLLLKDVVKVIDGYADIAEQHIVEFSHPDGRSRLETIFSKAVTERWEGLVLKGCEDPYVSMFPGSENGSAGRWIKLKKDYIPGLGDTVDLALIGAKYDSRDAAALNLSTKIFWTHFYIGCLVNKDAVLQSAAEPKFQVMDVIDHNSMSLKNMQILNQFGQFGACSLDSGHGFWIEFGKDSLSDMNTVFKKPFVVEMLGGGFEKPSGARYFTLRFPRVQKIFLDRSFEEAASYQELQLSAEEARMVPAEDLHQEEEWRRQLQQGQVSSHYIVTKSQTTSSGTSSCPMTTSSPSKGPSFEAIATTVIRTQPQHSSRDSIQQWNRVNEERVPADAIPIFVDDSMTSASSPEPSEPPRKLLRSNDNLSSIQGSSKKRNQESPSDPSKGNNASYGEENETTFPSNDSNASNELEACIILPLQPRKRRKLTENHASNVALVVPSSCSNQHRYVEAPLTMIPLYFRQDLDHDDSTNTLIPPNSSNLAGDIQTFVQKVCSNRPYPTKSSNSSTGHHDLALGLYIATISQDSLGSLLLELSQQVSTALKSNRHKSPRSGKIFILDAKFLALKARLDDPRFLLRMTWESIGREYFYACVSWSWETGVEYANDGLSEIPGTPAAGDGGQRLCLRESVRSQSAARAPRISITFDSRELGVLGDLSA